MKNRWRVNWMVTVALGLWACQAHSEDVRSVDVCIYGATPSGILAAVAVKRKGRSVVIVEPSRWVGGMLGAGLKPMQDCPNFAATGGLTRELLPKLGTGGERLAEGEARALNPAAIREDFLSLIEQHEIPLVFEHRIASCEKEGATLRGAVFDLAPFDESGCPRAEAIEPGSLRVTARVFIDASYEGDLMDRAEVSWRVGRESEEEFGEDLAGVREPMELTPIGPFVESGNPGSGLLQWVEDDHGKPVGAADEYTQAYNFRYYTTTDPAHRIPLDPPVGYDPAEFELVGRYVAHLVETVKDSSKLKKALTGIFPGWKNSGEWNYQRDTLFSMAPLGISQRYASGDYTEKAAVWKRHQEYLQGLHRFMSTDPRVPEGYRREVAEMGLDRRAHPETGGWPHQLYIRVARRLVGRYTITAHDVYNRREIEDPVGLAQYGIDTYPARRIQVEQEGNVLVGIEGKMFIGGGKGPTNVPYAVPYRAITPRAEECTNLLVPVCFSASHLGYASARMEPVFMICGESAGIAAHLAIAGDRAVQEIDAEKFREALLAAGQKLEWNPDTDRSTASDTFTFQKLLGECDRDGDGQVSGAEWAAGKPGWDWIFPRIDTDTSGDLDAGEYAAFQQFKRDNTDWVAKLKER